MSTNYFFKQFGISNYRGIVDLEVPRLRRVNVIGGLNGSGKTTLLEALFGFADLNNPIGIAKPAIWRQLPSTLAHVAAFTFHDADRTKPVSFRAVTRDGEFQLSYRYEVQPAAPLQQVAIDANAKDVARTLGGSEGITLELKQGDVVIDKSHITDTFNGVQVYKAVTGKVVVPSCALLTKATINNALDLSGRFSHAVQTRNKNRVLSLAQLLSPQVRDLQLLQIGETTYLHGEVAKDVFVPASFLGDGTLTLLSIGLAVIQSVGGAVFLDEFDTAIHFSRLKKVWGEIAALANEFNCQIFAATHSRECIQAAFEGLQQTNSSRDLQYMRLDRGSDTSTRCTIYTSEELENALNESWEIR